mmetsp:Transcript_138211/g.240484  ORF Transcript_138211/g.240484 Transcript_138211/m.240484 type:complete len:184 (-) Transcript_138211:65-616(-)
MVHIFKAMVLVTVLLANWFGHALGQAADRAHSTRLRKAQGTAISSPTEAQVQHVLLQRQTQRRAAVTSAQRLASRAKKVAQHASQRRRGDDDEDDAADDEDRKESSDTEDEELDSMRSPEPRNVEDEELIFGMPKIVWVILCDILAMGAFIAAIPTVMTLAKKRKPEGGCCGWLKGEGETERV